MQACLRDPESSQRHGGHLLLGDYIMIKRETSAGYQGEHAGLLMFDDADGYQDVAAITTKSVELTTEAFRIFAVEELVTKAYTVAHLNLGKLAEVSDAFIQWRLHTAKSPNTIIRPSGPTTNCLKEERGPASSRHAFSQDLVVFTRDHVARPRQRQRNVFNIHGPDLHIRL